MKQNDMQETSFEQKLGENTMSTNTGTLNTTDGIFPETPRPDELGQEISTAREKWIKYYANRMLRCWLQWRSPLGVARDYVEQLRENLAEFYDEPLKKIFIETTY